ncbi:uncharacterized protein [Palaemon carinicauda]|uniref:uncharacterized protein n=1 Tax=Palaemon carinicauda TaxID=392227 RepID=UPI0035B626E4
MDQTLLIAVAVLGTVVGIGLISAIMGLCFRWQKKKIITHAQCCWHHQTESLDAYSFPPPHRERIKMRCMRGCNNFTRDCCQMSLSNNNTGVSRGLGLGASCINDPVPAPPAPRSWTPSPPYRCQQNGIHSRRGNQSKVGEQSCHLGSHRVSTAESLRNECGVHSNLSVITKKENSYCKPRSCLQLSNKYEPATNTKCDLTDIKVDSNSADSDNSSEIVDLSHKRMKAHFYRKNKRSSRSSRTQNVYQRKNTGNGEICINKQPNVFANNLDQSKKGFICNDHPAACSSYYISPSKGPQPLSSHNPTVIIHDDQNVRGSPNCHAGLNQGLQYEGIEYGQSHRNLFNLDHSRRLETVLPQIRENSSSPVSFAPATRSHWVHADSQVNNQISTAFLQPAGANTSRAFNPPISKKDELIKRDFADKYGFCQSCGHHPDSHKISRGVKMITRSTQTPWGSVLCVGQVNQTQETTVDPTPSLSWDHLNHSPSPAYLQTVVVETTRDDEIITEEDEGEFRDSNITEERTVLQGRDDVIYSPHLENEERGAVGGW